MGDQEQRGDPPRAGTALTRFAASGWFEGLVYALVTAFSVVLYLGAVRDLAGVQGPFRLPLWAVTLASTLIPLYLIRIEFRRTVEFSVYEIVLVLGLFFASPVNLVLGRVIGGMIARNAHRRGRWWTRNTAIDLTYEGVATLFETCMALLLFDALRGPASSVSSAGLLAALVATVVSGVARILLVELAILPGAGALEVRRWLGHIGFGIGVSTAAAGLALVAVVVLWRDAATGWVLAVPLGLLVLVFHVATKDRSRHDSVRFLYETTRAMQGAEESEAIAVAALTQARDIFQAESTQLLLPGAGDQPATRIVVGQDHVNETLPFDAGTTVWGRLATLDEFEIVGGPGGDPELAAAGIRQAMVAPLHGRGGQLGVVLVANRLGTPSTFHPEELQLLEALANHTSVALDNIRLLGDLRDQALHDALTGLANRTLLLERTEQAIARARRAGSLLAVLLLDLDGFKTVNDSLGHAAGDKLLLAVADRIRACIRPSDTAARLGGDEFAVLLDGADDPDEAVNVAERLVRALSEPVTLHGREVVPAGSVGVAVRDGWAGPGELLRDADAAMYAAKRAGKGRVALFKPHMHQAALDRLEQTTTARPPRQLRAVGGGGS